MGRGKQSNSLDIWVSDGSHKIYGLLEVSQAHRQYNSLVRENKNTITE